MRIAIVGGVVIAHDAISAAVLGQARLLESHPEVERVDIFAQSLGGIDRPNGHVVGDPWSLVVHPRFRECDVAIFHWGIRYDLFDAITLLTRDLGPTPVIHFHNCTPASLVAPVQRPMIEASLQQIHHAISLGSPVWTYSEFNRLTLLDWGVSADRVKFVPFPIEGPASSKSRRGSSRVELLAVGRMTPAKGQDVLIDAMALLSADVRRRVRLRIVSNSVFSDSAWANDLRARVERDDLGDIVQFVDDADEAALWRLYAQSHVVISPSRHEGLCVPVVEGYLAGCRAIASNAGNLPYLVQPPDPIVESGDPAALRLAIESVVNGELNRTPNDVRRSKQLALAYSVDSCRVHLERELGLNIDVPRTSEGQPFAGWPLRRSDH